LGDDLSRAGPWPWRGGSKLAPMNKVLRRARKARWECDNLKRKERKKHGLSPSTPLAKSLVGNEKRTNLSEGLTGLKR